MGKGLTAPPEEPHPSDFELALPRNVDYVPTPLIIGANELLSNIADVTLKSLPTLITTINSFVFPPFASSHHVNNGLDPL